MFQLAVVVVSYNVRYFLQQTLWSVRRAAEGLSVEVWVVDNCSRDGSVEMVREQFPEVRLIANADNVGFSTANNQAIRLSQAEYVLLLNPDTVVAEDTFSVCLDFMRRHERAGGLGLRMIDGRGVFLPESKRGFPSPLVAFYKSFGLHRFFPRSAHFNQYYLGHLSEFANCRADVLSGAFMLMRKKALEEVGLLDEAFFMYGEDIDLSYRLVRGGWENYYIADTQIIHYKGESTKKGSLNYVKTFYQAMIIFTQKHFANFRLAALWVLILRGGIYFRASLTLLGNWYRAFRLPLLDAMLMYGGLWLLRDIWAIAHFRDADYFPSTLLYINFPIYIAVWLGGMYLRGCYDAGNAGGAYRQLLGGVAMGTLLVAAIYGFLPDDLRYSRMLIVLGALWAVLATSALRLLGRVWQHKGLFSAMQASRQHKTLIVGSGSEVRRVLGLLYDMQADFYYVGAVAQEQEEGVHLGKLADLPLLLRALRVSELIFCAADISHKDIIAIMEREGSHYQYKIVQPESDSIIGSNSKDAAGDHYELTRAYALARVGERRTKRLFDISVCLFLLLFLPLLFWFQRKKGAFLSNLWAVFLGRRTWVGYSGGGAALQGLPPLKVGVLSPADRLNEAERAELREMMRQRLNQLYAKEYTVFADADVLLRNWRRL